MSGPSPLTLPQVIEFLRATMGTLRAEAGALGPDAMRWHPAGGEWCLNEVLGHIIEAEERGFAGRIRDILAGKEIVTWDQEQVARERKDCERDGLGLLRELEEMREHNTIMVAGLSGEKLRKTGVHPDVGEHSVTDLLHEWVHHDRAHVKQALSIVQAYVWPNMGNTQRFSEID
ncbi:MAG: DinB family protein [Dehalococcoidia bacterium]